MMVKIRIETVEDWSNLIAELLKAGLLESARCEELALEEENFPMDILVDLDPLLKMASSPIAKPFRKKIQTGLVNRAMELIAQQE